MAATRRGFLKCLASLLPAAALSNVVKTQADAVSVPAPVKGATAKTIKNHSSLKHDRYVTSEYCRGFCDSIAEKGTVVELVKFSPSLIGDQYPILRPGRHSGQPMGILMQDVVHVDPRYATLGMRDSVQVGGKVSVCQDGWLTVGPFNKPVEVGEQMYYNEAGRLTTVPTGRPIGVALSSSDEDGFARIKVNLYVNEGAKLP